MINIVKGFNCIYEPSPFSREVIFMKWKTLTSLVTLPLAGLAASCGDCVIPQPNTGIEQIFFDEDYYDNNNLKRQHDETLQAVIDSTERVNHQVTYEVTFEYLDGRKETSDKTLKGFGSGIVYARKGNYKYIITNHHVAGKSEDITIRPPKIYGVKEIRAKVKSEKVFVVKNGKEITLELLASDSVIDAALLRSTSHELEVFQGKIGDSSLLKPGDFLYVIGNPLGEDKMLRQGIVSKTSVNDKFLHHNSPPGKGQYKDWFVMQPPLNPGNSGGPIIALHEGEYHFVGISVAQLVKRTPYGSIPHNGMNYGVKINPIMDMVDKYFKKNKY